MGLGKLPGWWEGGTPQTDVFGRLTDDGSAFGVGYERGRAVTVDGVAAVPVGTSHDDAVARLLVARRRLREAVSLNADVELTVDEGALGVLRLPVRQSLAPRFTPGPTVYAFAFEVPVVSSDWRKTSQTLTQTVLGAGGVLTNPGNAAATPVLRISGDSAANVGVTNATTGETISTTLNLGGGDVLLIDCDTGRATLNGVDTSDNLALGSRFFDLVVGAQTINLVNAGAASLRVDYRTSWK